VIIPSRRASLGLAALSVAAFLAGLVVAIHYARLDLTLSHYDARGHLIVARRIFDSLTPGWWQIGAIWLPLPHLLNALPVQVDALYRTGWSAVLISIASYAVATAALFRMVVTVTGSALAGLLAALVFALNPNLLYLQSTPMTEPLFLGLTLLAVAMTIDWCDVEMRAGAGTTSSPGLHSIGTVFALACLTRYEAWPVSLSAIALSAGVLWWRRPDTTAWSRALRLFAYPVGAILGFMVFSRIVIGEWFVASGFYVPDNPARGQVIAVAQSLLQGVEELSGPWLLTLGAAGLAVMFAVGLFARERAIAIVPLALITTATLPFSAFFAGHPFRVRYMVPLIAAQAIGIGMLVGVSKWLRIPAAIAAAFIITLEIRPLDPGAPMVVEAQWDRPDSRARAAVTECLRRDWNGEAVLASMGSLGHYMQELSHAGLDIRDFIHEGNELIWAAATEHARPYAGWVLISERADNRDALTPMQGHSNFLEGFERVCEGGQVALYRRRPSGP